MLQQWTDERYTRGYRFGSTSLPDLQKLLPYFMDMLHEHFNFDSKYDESIIKFIALEEEDNLLFFSLEGGEIYMKKWIDNREYIILHVTNIPWLKISPGTEITPSFRRR